MKRTTGTFLGLHGPGWLYLRTCHDMSPSTRVPDTRYQLPGIYRTVLRYMPCAQDRAAHGQPQLVETILTVSSQYTGLHQYPVSRDYTDCFSSQYTGLYQYT